MHFYSRVSNVCVKCFCVSAVYIFKYMMLCGNGRIICVCACKFFLMLCVCVCVASSAVYEVPFEGPNNPDGLFFPLET